MTPDARAAPPARPRSSAHRCTTTPFPELQVAPHAPSGCDSRTGRDRELGIDIFAPESLALVQRCQMPHGSKVPPCARWQMRCFGGGEPPGTPEMPNSKKKSSAAGGVLRKVCRMQWAGSQQRPGFRKILSRLDAAGMWEGDDATRDQIRSDILSYGTR